MVKLLRLNELAMLIGDLMSLQLAIGDDMGADETVHTALLDDGGCQYWNVGALALALTLRND
jgi:hypothetical protein